MNDILFKNNNEAVIKKLAKRSMTADKRRNMFVVITIALAVCLMGTICFSYSSQRLKTMERIQGQYQAGCIGMTHESIDRLVETGRFEKWGYATNTSVIRYKESNLNVNFVSPGMIDLMQYGEITGAYPQTENEICIERAFLDYYSLPVTTGQSIVLDLGAGEREYTIVGILENENNSRIFTVWISEAIAAASNDAPFELRFRFAGTQIGDTEHLRADIGTFFNEMGIPRDNTFYSSNYFDTANIYLGSGVEVYVLAVLIAAVCAIVIYNIFYISVMGKMREYGRLKVLGATPKQLRGVVKRERLFLTAVSIPLGLILSALITMIVMPGYWSWADNIKFATIISVLTAIVVVIATRTPLKLVGKVSAIEAIRTTAYSQEQGRHVSKQLHRKLTMPRLALMNFSRNRKKSAITLLSLGLTGVLLICVAAYANSVDAREMALATFGDGSNYLLEYEYHSRADFLDVQTDNPLDASLKDQIISIPEVDYITSFNSAPVMVPQIKENEPFYVRGLTQEQMDSLLTENEVLAGSADYQQLLEQDGILFAPCGDTMQKVFGADFNVGDTITLSCYNGQTKSYTVMGIVEDVPLLGHFFILPEEELHNLYPEIEDFTAYVNIHAANDSDLLRQKIFDTVSDNRITISVLDDRVNFMNAELQKVLTMFYGILIFVFVFALLNLTNTLITNLLSRQQELGVFQSIGMSNRQLSRMLSFECLLYIGITLLITLTVGTVGSLIVCNVFDQVGIFGKLTYQFPVIQMLIFAGALIIVQVLFSAYAGSFFKRQCLVERIKAT